MKNQIKFAIIAIVIVIPICSYSVWASDASLQFSKDEQSSKLKVISSFYPLYDFAQKVGKDNVDVQLLVPEGVEPHDWEPTIQDVQQIQKSDLIIINGIGFETWVDKLEAMNYQGYVLDTSQGINYNVNILDTSSDNKGSHQENDHKRSTHLVESCFCKNSSAKYSR